MIKMIKMNKIIKIIKINKLQANIMWNIILLVKMGF